MRKRGLRSKLLSILLAGCMVVSLAACSSQSNQKNDSSKKEGTESATNSKADKYEVTLGRMTTANPKLPDGDTYEDNAYTRWAEEVLNVDLKDAFEANGTDYDTQISLALSSGELPDMMTIRNQAVLEEMVDNDLIADLTEVWDKYASDTLKEAVDSFDGRALDRITFDGKIMMLPATDPDPGPTEAWIRSDWLQELGIKVDADHNHIITLDELKMIAKEFLEKNPGKAQNPVGMAFTPNLTGDDPSSANSINAITSAFGAYPRTWMNDNGQVSYGSTLEPMKSALSLAADWFKEGIIDPQLGTRTWDDITSLLTNGQIGIVFGPWHMPDWLLNNVRELDKNATFEAYAIEDEKGRVNTKHINPVVGGVVVRKGFKHPEIAIQIANLFYDTMKYKPEEVAKYPEVENYINNAVDGTARPFNIEMSSSTSLLDDYADIEKGVKDEIKIEDARTVESQNVIKSVKAYLADSANAATADWARYHSRMKGIGLIQSLTESNTINFITPVFPVETDTMKTNMANLNKLEEETFLKIVTGATPVDSGFQDFVSQWNKQGGEQIIKEIQDQIK